MNEITALRAAAPEAPPLRAGTLLAARAALLDEIEASSGPRARARRRRRVGLRVGVAGLTAAAAWTAAVVIAAPDAPPGPPPATVALVAFTPPTFPLSLDPVPPGLSPSDGSADPGGILHGSYTSADGADSIAITVTPDEPDLDGMEDIDSVQVAGREAEVVRGAYLVCGGPGPSCEEESVPYVQVVVEWRDGQWVQVSGSGRFAGADRLLAVAGDLVDRPVDTGLRIGLAPVGWSVLAYKDGRILTLVADGYPDQTLTVHLPEQSYPADELRAQLMGPVGPLLDVTVNDRPAQLVRVDNGPRDRGWYLQAQFTDGTTFVVQAPEAFNQEQVLQFAAQVTHAG